MTEPDADPVRAFLAALPGYAASQLNRTQRLVVLIHKAVHTQNWTPKQLADECSRGHTGAVNAAGVVMFRLEHCAEHGPAQDNRPRRIHNGCCQDGWIYDETGDVALTTKCPGNAPTEVSA